MIKENFQKDRIYQKKYDDTLKNYIDLSIRKKREQKKYGQVSKQTKISFMRALAAHKNAERDILEINDQFFEKLKFEESEVSFKEIQLTLDEFKGRITEVKDV